MNQPPHAPGPHRIDDDSEPFRGYPHGAEVDPVALELTRARAHAERAEQKLARVRAHLTNVRPDLRHVATEDLARSIAIGFDTYRQTVERLSRERTQRESLDRILIGFAAVGLIATAIVIVALFLGAFGIFQNT